MVPLDADDVRSSPRLRDLLARARRARGFMPDEEGEALFAAALRAGRDPAPDARPLTFVEIGAGQSNSGYGLAEALLVIGAFTAPCVGVPCYFYGAHKVSRAYAYATPTGGGIRVTF